MKDLKKVKAGKRLAEWNCKKREECTQLAKVQSESNITYYGAGAIVAIGVLGVKGYITFTNPRIWFTNPRKLWFTDPKKLQPTNLKWSRL